MSDEEARSGYRKGLSIKIVGYCRHVARRFFVVKFFVEDGHHSLKQASSSQRLSQCFVIVVIACNGISLLSSDVDALSDLWHRRQDTMSRVGSNFLARLVRAPVACLFHLVGRENYNKRAAYILFHWNTTRFVILRYGSDRSYESRRQVILLVVMATNAVLVLNVRIIIFLIARAGCSQQVKQGERQHFHDFELA